MPDVEHLPFPMDQLDKLTLPDPRTDGFMPLCLYRFEKLKKRICAGRLHGPGRGTRAGR